MLSCAERRHDNREKSGTHRYSQVMMLSCVTLLFSFPAHVKPLLLEDPTMPTIPISIDGSIRFRPLVDPRSTVVLASKTRLDASRTDLCRRPRRVVSSRFAFNPRQKPSRDTRHDVRNVDCDAFVGVVGGRRRWMSILERG